MPRLRRARQQAAAAKAAQVERAAARRTEHLARLTSDLDRTWREIDTLIATKTPKGYDQAVRLLVDLREIANRDGTHEAYAQRLTDLHARHRAKPSLMRRFEAEHLLA